MTHEQSAYTDYSIKEGSTVARMPSFPAKNTNSRIQSYILKLQALCKDISSKIKSNRPVIQQLQCQRRFYKRICEKQKQRLDSVNLALIRQEYEAQLDGLREKRSHMHDMIANIHEQAEEKKATYLLTHCSLVQSQQFLQHSLQELYSENKRYRQMLQKKMETVSNQKNQIGANSQLILDKQKIQEKYKLVLQEIELKQKGVKSDNK